LSGRGAAHSWAAGAFLALPPANARDALLLAGLLRVGDIVAVRVPSEAEEATRDLVRAREDVRGDLMRARHRLSKLLPRHGAVWDGKDAWTTAHEALLRRQAATFTASGLRAAFDADHEAVLMALTRRDRLDAAIEQMAANSQFTHWCDGWVACAG
jgi:transposase